MAQPAELPAPASIANSALPPEAEAVAELLARLAVQFDVSPEMAAMLFVCPPSTKNMSFNVPWIEPHMPKGGEVWRCARCGKRS